MIPEVSIIVPIYNMERYLSRCLDSLLAQSLTNLEIIAVNDGSTDGSAAILEQYAAKDGRLVVINKPNGGVSAARNDGISAARGRYIGFVDPDDWVEQEMYETLLKEARMEDADIAMCGYTREFGTHAKVKDFHLPEKVSYRQGDVQSKLMRRLVGPLGEEIGNPELLDAWGTVWSKLYRSDLIKSHKLEFVDLRVIGTNEDSLFNIHAFGHARGFVFVNRPLYHYWRANEASVTSGYKPNLQQQWSVLYTMIDGFLRSLERNADYDRALSNRICLNVLGLGLNTISPGNTASVPGKLRKLHTILHDPAVRRAFRQLDMKHFSIVWKVFYGSAKLRVVPAFYLLLVAMDRLRRMAR
ncbi:glycosyltransferase [Paenibacillus chartarius]|uniref:Glycosyltransferase n=1 Tax=Paenibacillus chartarius TaxID=747481 RepID=A0ABV6DVB1_9BACL